jgi:hypothetical protein
MTKNVNLKKPNKINNLNEKIAIFFEKFSYFNVHLINIKIKIILFISNLFKKFILDFLKISSIRYFKFLSKIFLFNILHLLS